MKRQPPSKFFNVQAVLVAALAFAAVLIGGLPDAVADSALRCGNRVVSLGATPAEVTEKCGDPDYVEQWEEGGEGYVFQLFDYETQRYLAPRLLKGPVRMERWTYDFGTNKFIRYLTFQNGQLIKIHTGDKGSH